MIDVKKKRMCRLKYQKLGKAKMCKQLLENKQEGGEGEGEEEKEEAEGQQKQLEE